VHRDVRRRRYLQGLAVAGAAGIAGCGGDTPGGDEEDDPESTAPPPATETDPRTADRVTTETETTETPEESEGTAQLQALHVEASGDYRAAMTALFDGFETAHPDVSVAEDTGRRNVEAVVRNRLESGDPPGTWLDWPGASLTPYRDDLGAIEGGVWDEATAAAYPPELRRLVRSDGEYVAVPIYVHRVNNLFYNTAVVERAGVDPGALSTPEDLLDAFAAVAAETDAAPLSHPTVGWTTVQLWETVLLGQAGPEGYEAFVAGEGDRAAVESALETLTDYREFYPADASSVAFPEANARVTNGDAAFIQQGDWAASAYRADNGFEYGEDWGRIPFPGTDGSYLLNVEAFVHPDPNPTPEATTAFLAYCAGPAAQRRYSRVRGSVPPRTDVDLGEYPAFQRDQYGDYRSASARPPSIIHGLAVESSVADSITEALVAFAEGTDVGTTADALLAAFE
jgi:glucose/mannose transport system substrate-binding protein